MDLLPQGCPSQAGGVAGDGSVESRGRRGESAEGFCPGGERFGAYGEGFTRMWGWRRKAPRVPEALEASAEERGAEVGTKQFFTSAEVSMTWFTHLSPVQGLDPPAGCLHQRRRV